MERRNYSENLVIAANQNIKEREYWLRSFADYPGKTVFYYDFQQDAGDTLDIDSFPAKDFSFVGETFAKLMKLSNGSDARLHMILTAALAALCYRYTGSTDIVIGTPIYKQQSGAKFINTVLALRNTVEGDITFKELLIRVRQTIVDAVEHQNFPIGILAELVDPAGSQEEFPLFDAALLLGNVQEEAYLQAVQINLLFSFKRIDGRVNASLKYNPLRYNADTVGRLCAHFSRLLEAALADVDTRLCRIEMLSEEECRQLLLDFNANEMATVKDKPFHYFFAQQVQRHPDRIALIGEGLSPFTGYNNDVDAIHESPQYSHHVSYTYKKLDETSDHLALFLRQTGLKTGNIVAAMLDRCVEMIVAVMGIMKAGGAYLPIDPAYPAERISFMLKDSSTRLLLTLPQMNDRIPTVFPTQGEVINITSAVTRDIFLSQEHPGKTAGAEDPVYVIYTSGSTGKPKGVMVPHDCFVNAAFAWQKEYRLQEMEVNLLQMASFSFDVFAGDIARTLFNGGKMVINPSGVLDPESLYRLVIRHKVSLFEATPSYIIPFMNYVYSNDLVINTLQLLILGSDSFSTTDFQKLRQRYGSQMRIVNSYGVTEAAIDSSYYEAPGTGPLTLESNVPIGKPMPNIQFLILDNSGNLLPIGVPGELYIGGAGVTRGYLNRPELTAERFVALNRSNKSYMTYYKTGDLARWLPDGNVEFLGRSDLQVKIRGYRIELGEIENKLLEHQDIEEAVVVRKGTGSDDSYLCGYIVPTDHKPLESGDLRDYLGQKLPDYMVPWFFMTMEKFPLTPNGKLDRTALPEPETHEDVPYAAPRNQTEKTLVDIWAQVLEKEADVIGIDTDFFDLGGNSLKAIITGNKIHKAFDVQMQLTDIFQLQTIRRIAKHLEQAVPLAFSAVTPAEEKEYYPLSSAQKRLFFLQQLDPGSTVYNMPTMVLLEVELEKEQVEKTFRALLQRHESLRTSFMLVKGEPVQRVHRQVEFDILYHPETNEPGNVEAVTGTFIQPFDLAEAPLVRIGIIRLRDGTHLLMADIHHIISDGVSQNVLIRDIVGLYLGKPLPDLPVQYKDYTQWQQSERERQDDTLKEQETFWLQEFAAAPPVLNLPTDFPRPEIKRFEGKLFRFSIDPQIAKPLKTLAASSGVTLYMVLLAAFNVLLARSANQQDIVVGTVTAGRRHADLEHVIGMFVNTLALMHRIGKETSFQELLQQVKEKSLKAFDNQDYPFEHLVEKAPVNRDTSRDPLFDVLFVFENFGKPEEMEAGTDAEPQSALKQYPYSFGSRIAKFDLSLYALEEADSLSVAFEYCTALFKQETVEFLYHLYKEILKTVGKEPNIKIKDIPLECGLLPLGKGFEDIDIEFSHGLN
jgi:gramicidin S synthase 2/tyrocidine synthetase-3